VENSTPSSNPQESQQNSNVMDLVALLYGSREQMPLQAEPDEATLPEGE
jgi:hypothetical protein